MLSKVFAFTNQPKNDKMVAKMPTDTKVMTARQNRIDPEYGFYKDMVLVETIFLSK